MFNTKKTNNNYPSIIKEVHNEFLSAADRGLKEAENILSELAAKSTEKGKRLNAVGFTSVPEAAEARSQEMLYTKTREAADLVRYYKSKYPLNKFITEGQVELICEKYGLVCGDVSMYKGFVPEPKLSLIESFSVKEEDLQYAAITHYGEVLEYITKEDVGPDLVKYFSYPGSLKYIYVTSIGGANTNYSFRVPMYEKYKDKEFVRLEVIEPKLKICAPLKDMDISARKMVVRYKIQDIPDPVILYPVRGGYLIVCAWGDEATDEMVFDQKQN